MMSRMTSHITKSFTPTLCIERGTMKITTIKLLAFALAITVGAGGTLLLLPDHSHAAVTCPSTSTNDADGDGFTDAEECSGITLLDGVTVTSCVAGVDRNSCLDPNSKDVFVIVVPAAGSTLLGADPLRILKGTNVTGTKLGLAIHQITEGQTTDRRVNGSQNAIRITESLDTADVTTGICNQGTPNGLDGCVVYTQRIVNFVNSKCPAGVTCLISPATSGTAAAVISTFIQNTIAHEASHSLSVTATYNSRYGGNHYQTGTNVVMDQSVYYTVKGTKATFFLPGAYATADPSAVKLN